MAEIVGVVFRGGMKVYHFDPAGLELSRGDRVVVQTMSGPEIGQVVEPTHTVDDSELPAPLKKVVRVATGKDLENQAANEDLRREAMASCRELIESHGLDMKLVGADIGFGGEKITFNFFSEERVDFRALVADLAKTLKMRIELRQVGAREEARMVGGLGPCGRGLCCTLFPGDDEPVSIRMAKEQNLPLNPMKISGLCGRLMCCLKYEQEQYVRFRKEAPSKGTPVSTPGGEGVVAGYNVTKESITVRLEDGSCKDVRLSACEEREDGTLLVVEPEIKEPLFIPMFDDIRGLQALAKGETAEDGLPVVEAQVVLDERGEPVEVVVAESARRGRSRRSRSRRKGRGKEQASGEAGTGAADAQGGGGAAGGDAKRGQRTSQGGSRRPAGERIPAREGGGVEQSGSAGSSRSRRRRRPRRPGGGGSDGGSGGGPVGGSGGGGDSGNLSGSS
ncbi:MAG: stage 0 sporulation family protein [Thermoleophilia bacterium]|nr:stage 0 sporulation family protein [Thermoleophilia bacterium]